MYTTKTLYLNGLCLLKLVDLMQDKKSPGPFITGTPSKCSLPNQNRTTSVKFDQFYFSNIAWKGMVVVLTRSQPCRYCLFGPKGALTALKRVYLVKRSIYIYSARNFPPYPMWDVTNTPPCRYNVLVVSHGIVGPNKQTPLTGPNKPPHRGRGSALIPFVMARFNRVNIVCF